MITRNTLEEKILGLQKFKLKTANSVITKDNSSLSSMATDQVFDLFSLDEANDINDTSGKVEKILEGSLDSIPSLSPSVKIQIMGRKVCLRCKDKTLLDVVNNLLKTKSLLTSPSNVLPYYLK